MQHKPEWWEKLTQRVKQARDQHETELDLGNLGIGVEGAIELAKYLPDLKTVQTLKLYNNVIGDAGAQALAQVLPNTNITLIRLGGNNIGAAGAQALAQVMPNTNITLIRLGDNYVDSALKEQIYALAKANQTKTTKAKAADNKVPQSANTSNEKERKATDSKSEEKLLACLNNGFAPCTYVKVVLGGEGTAGKTATMQSLFGKPFNQTIERTNGININSVLMSEQSFTHKPQLEGLVKQGLIDAASLDDTTASASNSVAAANTSRSSTTLPTSTNSANTTATTPQPQQSQIETGPKFVAKLLLDENVKLAFTKTTLNQKPSPNPNKCITALFYDCGGQDIYQTANELFFTPRSVVMLMFNMQEMLQMQSKSLDVLMNWCQNITLHTPTSPIILVGTRADQVGGKADHVAISSTLKWKLGDLAAWKQVVHYSDDIAFVPVNNTMSANDSGIKALRQLIIKTTKSQPFFKERFPVRWLRCLDTILALKDQPLMRLDDFTNTIARPCGVASEEEVKRMCKQLHELGFIAYYNDAKLKDWVVTNPQKVIDAISALITSKHHLEKLAIRSRALLNKYLERGRLDRLLIREIWQSHNLVKEEEEEMFIQLLEYFDLMCELVQNSSQAGQNSSKKQVEAGSEEYLVPAMLPTKNDPSLDHIDFTTQNRARAVFQHVTGALPMGVYHRLIAKCVRWSQLTTTFTSTVQNTLQLDKAILVFGRWKVKIVHETGVNICFAFESPQAASVTHLMMLLIEEVKAEAFPCLQFLIEVEIKVSPPMWVNIADLSMKQNQGPLSIIDSCGNCVPISKLSAWLNNEAVQQHDCFLSYRRNTDKERVRVVNDCITLLCIDDQRHCPNVFFDLECLELGQEWDLGFATALFNTNVFIPVVSKESLQSIRDNPITNDDNLMLEWALAVELKAREKVKAIVPLVVTEGTPYSEMGDLPHLVNAKVNSACIRFLEKLGVMLTCNDKSRLQNQTLKEIGTAISRCNGICVEEGVATAKGRNNWSLFTSCTQQLEPILFSHRNPTPVPRNPNALRQGVQDVVDWMNRIGLDENSSIMAKQSNLTLNDLCCSFSDPSHMNVVIQRLGLTDVVKINTFKKELKAHMLKQSIEEWLNDPEVDMGDRFQTFKAKGCGTFGTLFEVVGITNLFDDFMKEVGISEMPARMFTLKVLAKKLSMLGA